MIDHGHTWHEHLAVTSIRGGRWQHLLHGRRDGALGRLLTQLVEHWDHRQIISTPPFQYPPQTFTDEACRATTEKDAVVGVHIKAAENGLLLVTDVRTEWFRQPRLPYGPPPRPRPDRLDEDPGRHGLLPIVPDQRFGEGDRVVLVASALAIPGSRAALESPSTPPPVSWNVSGTLG